MKQVDGFEDVDPVVQEKYKKFVAFYNPFQDNWKKAVVSSSASEVEIQPLVLSLMPLRSNIKMS